MGTIEQSLEQLMRIEGALGCCLVNHRTRTLLGKASIVGLELDLAIAASGNIEVVKATTKAIEMLTFEERIGDIMLTLTTQVHIVRPSEKHKNIFVFIAFDKDKTNLALARRKVLSIERELVLESDA